jgi:transcriptional regulator with PAS, ATPase and Fis domain
MKKPDENTTTAVQPHPKPTSSDLAKRDQFRLTIISGEEVKTRQLVGRGVLSIGRSGNTDIQILDSTASRHHANLIYGPKTFVEDCGSLNGVWVGGKRLSPGEKVEVTMGEIIELGDAMLVIQKKSVSQEPRQIWEHSFFDARLTYECNQPEQSFAVMLAHVAGKVPKKVVENAISLSLRAGDVAASHSKNEYEFLILDATPATADAVCRRFTENLGKHKKKVNTGIACYPRDARSAGELVAKARAIVRGDQVVAGTEHIIIENEYMQRLARLVERIAPSNINVIIHGETGVGKEVIAKLVHRHSGRPEDLFVSINCAAVPESLLESELFGHESGAFTGASKAKPGLLEITKNGTFLLDEVSEMPMPLQAKLLRVLEERQAVRIGGLKPYQIGARFIATTNCDLEDAVQRGTFRQDLFFRLDGISLHVPPLRERISEIEPLAKAFIDQTCRQMDRSSQPIITDEALSWLNCYWWPGNVRELRNVVERAVLLCTDDRIATEHVAADKMASSFFSPKVERTIAPVVPESQPDKQPDPPKPAAKGQFSKVPTQIRLSTGSRKHLANLRDEVKELEYNRIIDALQRSGGNQTKAAKLLGISRRTLINRLDEYGIERPRKRAKKKKD